MSTFDDYNVLMNDLCLDLKQVTRGIVTLRFQITSENNKLDNVREQAAEEIQSFVGRLQPSTQQSPDGAKVPNKDAEEGETSVLAAFQKFKEDLEKIKPVQRSEKKSRSNDQGTGKPVEKMCCD